MITGQFVSQKDNYVTFRQDSDYEWKENEPVELHSVKTEFCRDLRKLFFCMIDWVVESGHIYELPPKDLTSIYRGQKTAAQKRILYYLVRHRIGYVETGYDACGYPIPIPKSLQDRNITDQKMQEVFTKARDYLEQFIGFEYFIIEYEEALQRLGKVA